MLVTNKKFFHNGLLGEASFSDIWQYITLLKIYITGLKALNTVFMRIPVVNKLHGQIQICQFLN